jgi:hypothetical protein
MTTFFAGTLLTAADLEALTPDPVAQIVSAADSGSLSSTEAVSLTLPSATYKANQAYAVYVGGGITYSVATAAFSSWTLRKGTVVAGATVCYFGRHNNGATTTLELGLLLQRVLFQVGSADVTTQLCLTAAVNGTNTAIHRGTTAGNPRVLSVHRAGKAASWGSIPVLS